MTLALQGTGVSAGIAVGPVHILQRGNLEISEYALPDQFIEEEIARFRQALEITREHLRTIRDGIPQHIQQDIVDFINAHILMLDDSALAEVPIEIIRNRRCNAEWALKLQRDTLVQVFEEMDDPYLRTRRDDVDHVVDSIQRVLLNSPIYHGVPHVTELRYSGHIIVVDDLSPADTVLMQHQGIAAFVTEGGGPTSHTAILARSLRIPAIVGLHHAQDFLIENETVIVDGQQGMVLAGPSEQITQYYQGKRKQAQAREFVHRETRDIPAITRDGTRIRLYANIELPEDMNATLESGAEGVGLYRTEYLFMNRPSPPSEQQQYDIYCRILQQLGGNPLTIRTLDLGADKQVDGGRHDSHAQTNPALGLRAIRLCLKEPSLFLPQLRAILRASAMGKVRLMLPMVSNTQELIQILRLIDDTRQQLRLRGEPFDPNIEIGGMIEVPAAAINASMFTEYLDFLSLGTNDLIQYTLAIDRIDDEVNYLYDPLNPAVLKLIKMTLDAGRQTDTPVTMCGEMAGDPAYTALLLGLGLQYFSMHPNTLPAVKRVILQSDIPMLQTEVAELLGANSHDQFTTQLEQFLHAHHP
jgi:phosphotransferase system enzyme I (PtsI)